MKKKRGEASTGNEGRSLSDQERRTLDFSKGAFGDVANDGVLPELGSGKQRGLVVDHLERARQMINRRSRWRISICSSQSLSVSSPRSSLSLKKDFFCRGLGRWKWSYVRIWGPPQII